jgi:uncharacterized membrane protein YedE/YeeE
MHKLLYLIAGLIFGFTLIKGETASWYRIQEMFHFQAFHMFGVLFSAIFTAWLGMRFVKRMEGRKSLEGIEIRIPSKPPGKLNYLIGGTMFGLGWGVIGLCPGPMFALLGSGSLGVIVLLIGALHGTWLYGALQRWLPH